jgi:lipopolysaccharide export system protein LptA
MPERPLPMRFRLPAPALLLAALLALPPLSATAQGTAIGFAGLQQDPDAPVEVVSDELTVNQSEGRAQFRGNVVVTQGPVRLSAGTVDVEYGADGAGIRRLTATGGVTFVTEADAAEADSADYSLPDSALVLTGNVLLTQGPATISGDRLVADLRAGTGRMEGRVRTVFRPDAGARD